LKGTDNLVDLKIGTSEVVSAFNSYNKFTQPMALGAVDKHNKQVYTYKKSIIVTLRILHMQRNLIARSSHW